VEQPTVYDVSGGAFTDGYGPEELVPGIITDGMNITVITQAGSPDPGELQFRINTNKYGQSTVYRENDNTNTSLSETTYNTGRTDDVLYVDDVTKLVEILEFTGLTVTDNQVTIISSTLLMAEITGITVYDTSSADAVVPWSSFTVDNIRQLTITLAESVSGLVRVRIAQGNKILIQNEQIQFSTVNIEDNYVTGLFHGTNGTITNTVYDQGSIVQSIQQRNILPEEYYDVIWSDGESLLVADTAPALFLQQSVY
jgi:hypothetical protein